MESTRIFRAETDDVMDGGSFIDISIQGRRRAHPERRPIGMLLIKGFPVQSRKVPGFQPGDANLSVLFLGLRFILHQFAICDFQPGRAGLVANGRLIRGKSWKEWRKTATKQ